MNEVVTDLFRVSVLVNNARQPIYVYENRFFIEATIGKEFEVSVISRNPDRIEILMSIDGRNTLRDEPASRENSGMVVDGYRCWRNMGWRENNSTVRKFVFANPEDTIAQKATGSTKNIGVIGVAAYLEYKTRAERAYFGNNLEFNSMPKGGFSRIDPSVFSLANSSRSMNAVGTGIGDRVRDEVGITDFTRASFDSRNAIEIQYRTHSWLLERGIIQPDYPASGYGKY